MYHVHIKYICRVVGDKYLYMVYKGKRKSIVKEKKGRKGCRVAAILFRAHTRCDGHCNRLAASLSLKNVGSLVYIIYHGISSECMCRRKKKTDKDVTLYTFFILQPNKTFNRMFYFIFFFYDFFLFEPNRIAVKRKKTRKKICTHFIIHAYFTRR